ncbi:MAG: zinc ribbon domain-containing protein [Syntrophobacterales bacterium]|nr:zinc ribbon domain-containing protein [Syntrophobacterales bacterium]
MKDRKGCSLDREEVRPYNRSKKKNGFKVVLHNVQEVKAVPIHEFKCRKCGKIFEYLCMRSDDRDHAVCPDCGHKKTDIQLSAFSCSGSGSAAGALSSFSAPCHSS